MANITKNELVAEVKPGYKDALEMAILDQSIQFPISFAQAERLILEVEEAYKKPSQQPSMAELCAQMEEEASYSYTQHSWEEEEERYAAITHIWADIPEDCKCVHFYSGDYEDAWESTFLSIDEAKNLVNKNWECGVRLQPVTHNQLSDEVERLQWILAN